MSSVHWVSGHLTGGLGNRLFQHSAAAGLAEKWKRPLVFNVNDCTPTNHGPFDNIFKLFPHIQIITEQENTKMLAEPPGHVFTYTAFPEEPPNPKENYCVDGWRQTEKYFPSKGVRPNVESALGQEVCNELLKTYYLDTPEKRFDAWFVHIRLGDYKNLDHHQIHLAGYYRPAMEQVPEGARVLVFCDEAKEYREILERFFTAMGRQVEIVDEPDELRALFLMSQCWAGAVVGNSTFSWWGAYLARKVTLNPTKYKAFFPKRWGKGLPPANDINPEWGIVIDNPV